MFLIKNKSLEIKIIVMLPYFQSSQTKNRFSYCSYIQLSSKPHMLKKMTEVKVLVNIMNKVRFSSESLQN